jgi:hypothetical protein
MSITAGKIGLQGQRPDINRERPPIDLFLASLAVDQGALAVGIILSGSGSDGTLGLKAIKEHGGLTLVQGTNGTAPRYPAMPANVNKRRAWTPPRLQGLEIDAKDGRRMGSRSAPIGTPSSCYIL